MCNTQHALFKMWDLTNGELFNEEQAIRYYFTRGYEYKDIVNILHKNHNYKLSYRSLLRRLQQYGLSRKIFGQINAHYDLLYSARTRINEIVRVTFKTESTW